MTSYRMNFTFLAVAIQKQSFIMNYKHIYIVNAIKSSKSCSKNNLQSGSCKLDVPDISSLDDDLMNFLILFRILSLLKRLWAHPSFSPEAINYIKKQGKRREVFVLFILQNSQNNLSKTSKNNINKVQLSSLFIDRIKTLKINDLNKKVTDKNDFKQSKKLMAWNKISKITSFKNIYSGFPERKFHVCND